jgi:hypothetical protein
LHKAVTDLSLQSGLAKLPRLTSQQSIDQRSVSGQGVLAHHAYRPVSPSSLPRRRRRLPPSEIARLRVGCIRWKDCEKKPGSQPVCFLHLTVNKTGTAFSKHVDGVMGRAVEL